MQDLPLSRQPENPGELRALSRVQHLRLASAWATVVWFPAVLLLVSTGAPGWALGLCIAGASFAALLRLAVALSRCPRCQERYSSHPGGFREIWHRDRCSNCGLARYAN